MSVSEQIVTGERADLLASLRSRRDFLRQTVRGLIDEQAARRSTASELCLGGLIKHVATTEERWMWFAVGGAEAMQSKPIDWVDQFRMVEGETLAGLLAEFDRVAAATDALVATLDLDTAHPLPVAPWFEAGASWSVRRVLLHVIAETAQHAGHADILRESIDGTKTMG
ncbi:MULTISPECIES: DinB family protein [Micromonospora]|uniref:DinB family protein n=1 Tax=Micromonospora solifontis TaxID=2487138 RepID=A0ABX9WL52_9ACTN|nr:MULTISPECIES: DinB family protein [Micromonospora]NES14865.1 DinB family protein [Micromonospora sp. PPF5-17B]NES35212.1 DinB family protein [Micromonospora solifontis]NES55207.1 DinB family protein [Micromonospora sp. PPF5-6]RNM01189.1 DinB family protein [Micromonospora solifontis]